MTSQTVSFGPFSLDSARGLLLRDGETLSVGQRAIAVLSALVEADGETVTKSQLMDLARQGLAVEEANLTVQIASLRKAMGPTVGGGDWIVTVPRVGYRLPRADPGAATAAAGGLPRIGVLPFANLSSDPEQDFFADGITEDVIAALSRFRSFTVAARSSSFALRGKAIDAHEAGRILEARYLLEGSVRRAGEVLRVSARLADAVTGGQLWAERFEGERGDVFAMQDRITEAVVGFVQPELDRAEIRRARQRRPENLDAYDLYLRALPLVLGADPAGYADAIELLRRAHALDPTFAMAAALLGWAYEKRLALNLTPLGGDGWDETVRLARLALTLAPDDPHVLVICGWLLIVPGNDNEAGLTVTRRALSANPNDVLVIVLAATAELVAGDSLRAQAGFHRALRLAPNAPDAYSHVAMIAATHLNAGDYEAALEWGKRSIETQNDWPPTYWTLTAAAAHLGRLDEARAYAKRRLELAPESSIAHFVRYRPPSLDKGWGMILDGLRKAGFPET